MAGQVVITSSRVTASQSYTPHVVITSCRVTASPSNVSSMGIARLVDVHGDGSLLQWQDQTLERMVGGVWT